jgi:hypothetical protein
MPQAPRFLCLLLPAAALTVLSGCAQLNLNKPSHWPFAREEKPGIPVRIATIWSDAVLYKANEAPMRGFGGRLFFYDQKDDRPIKVDGTLVVYAFDETGRKPDDPKPDHKYVFPASTLDLHFSESDIGHSYSFWLPWDEVAGEQKEISLIVHFLPTNGAPVISEQTTNLLPGTEPKQPAHGEQWAQNSSGATAATSPLQSVSYDAPTVMETPGQPAATSRIPTLTIPVPSRFSRLSVEDIAALHKATEEQAASPAGSTGQSLDASLATRFPHLGQAILAQQASLPPQARSAPEQSRLPATPSAQPTLDRTSWQPGPATSPPVPGP